MIEPPVATMAPDLAECSREPIHIPNAIQPHGAMLIASPDGTRITHASANLHEFLELRAAEALGKPLSLAIGESACRHLLGGEAGEFVSERHFAITGRSGDSLRVRRFHSGLRICVDIERLIDEPDRRLELTSAQGILRSFRDARSVGELCEFAVNGLRSVSGYDRVMAYRFSAEGHGEVVAEARAEDVESYLGQHYPASDIPEQARRLYLRHRVGIIVDSSYVPVPLLVDPSIDDATLVDLTHSALRSVSPVHREFMRNMNTTASMTIGIERSAESQKPELWGMLVCHHRTPRFADPEIRAAAELIGQILSVLIAIRTSAEVSAQQLEQHATLAKISTRLAQQDSIFAALSDVKAELLHLVNATGVILRLHGEVFCLGRTPDGAAIHELFSLLAESPGCLHAVDDLGARGTAFAECSGVCSGALMLRLSQDPQNAIIWIRPEQARTVTWGGNPAKATQADAVTGRISPRASFAAWKEVVLGRSLPWTAAQLSLATELGGVIESQIARRTKLVLDLFGRMFESSPVALMLIDRGGGIGMLNAEAARIFGYASAELVGSPLEQLVPARFRPRHAQHRGEYAANPSLRTMGGSTGAVGLRKDGSEFPIEVTLNPVVAPESGGTQLVQASIIDLTARRASEHAVRAAQERLLSIATHVPAMIGYWNRELRCEFANAAYAETFGLMPDRMVGAAMQDLLAAEQLAENEAYVTGALGGTEQHFERTSLVDGRIAYWDARYLPDRDTQGAVRGFYVLVTDVSSLQEARVALEATNSQLMHTNRELDQFVYTASHDLRSPLRAIGSLAQFVLEDDSSLQQQTLERLRLIISRSHRMQRMLDQILEYARAGKAGGDGKPVLADQLVEDIAATLGAPASFKIVADASLAAVQVRPMPIAQVLQNLIGNAIKHHDAGHGTVTISVQRNSDGLRFSVADDGPGIPPQYRESVFEMFTTLKRRDEVEGSGMGLALVRKLVKLQGGSCGIEGMPGRGTRIWFDWPSCDNEE